MNAARTWTWRGRLLVGGFVAASVVAALAIGWSCARPTSARPAAVAATVATRIELGRSICGECCTGRIWQAVGSLPGVADVTATAGQSTIVVHHDGRDGLSNALIAGLHKADFPEAALCGEPAGEGGPQRKWIRPVARTN